MNSLKQTILDAKNKGVAVGHFNISNIEGFWAIVEAGKELNLPVIIGLSEGERDYFGLRQAVLLARDLRERGEAEVYINGDHSYSVERVKEAIDQGVDAVIFDGAKLSLEDNIKQTRECVEYAKESGREVLVEAELGYIGGSSKLLDEIPEGVSLEHLTTADEASRFVRETGVDLFAPSVGNVHGMLKNAANPRLNINRVNEIAVSTGVPLVLHGGSGISDEDFVAAAKVGMSIIHISTELRRAFKDALVSGMEKNPDEIAPYKLFSSAREAMKKKAIERLRLFNNIS